MSTKLYVDTMASDKVVRRRRYGDERKALVLAECGVAGYCGHGSSDHLGGFMETMSV